MISSWFSFSNPTHFEWNHPPHNEQSSHSSISSVSSSHPSAHIPQISVLSSENLFLLFLELFLRSLQSIFFLFLRSSCLFFFSSCFCFSHFFSNLTRFLSSFSINFLFFSSSFCFCLYRASSAVRLSPKDASLLLLPF